MSLDEELRRGMAAQANGLVDVSSLLTRSTNRGKTLRRRRRAAVTLAVVVALGVGVGGPVVAWSTTGRPNRDAGPAGVDGQRLATAPMPPALPGQPTVLEDPSVLGGDPTLLHLSAEEMPPELAAVASESPGEDSSWVTGWGSTAGAEHLQLGSPITVSFWAGAGAREKARNFTRQGAVTVNDKPATLYLGALDQRMIVWQPVTGIWVAARGINGTTEQVLIAAASRLRFDRVSSCTVRFAVAVEPAGSALSTCDTSFTDEGITSNGRLIYRRADGSVLEIRDRGGVPSPETPNVTVAGHPANWRVGGLQGVEGEVLDADIPGGRNVTILITGSFTRAEAETLVAGLTWT